MSIRIPAMKNTIRDKANIAAMARGGRSLDGIRLAICMGATVAATISMKMEQQSSSRPVI
jgi:hypothetical protein